MIFVYKDRIIQIEWSIFRGTSQVPEDFSRALVKLFLVGNYEKYAVPVTAEGGTLVAQMPQDLPDGAYSLEAIWVKNYNNLFPVRGTDTPSVGSRNIRYPGPCHNDYGMTHPWDHRSNDRCLMRSRKDYVFAVTSYPGEETAVNEDSIVTVRINSAVATYGYDGLSAYELAVMRGDFNGTEGEWLESLGTTEIINNPDDEDLHSVDQNDTKVIQFANKEYNAKSFSGLGRMYLRKNISFDKNVLTQEMINKDYTRYIVQYDYDLNGKMINIPVGCILDFQGGSLTNGTLFGTNTEFLGSPRINCDFEGKFAGIADFSWFGLKPDDKEFDNALIINKYASFFSNIYIPTGKYYIKTPIVIDGRKNITVDGNISYLGDINSTCITIKNAYSNDININGFISNSENANLSHANFGKDTNIIGIDFQNCNNCKIYVTTVSEFNENMRVSGIGNGCSYNLFRFDLLNNGNVGLRIYQEDVEDAYGWANENMFIGGRIAISQSWNTEGIDANAIRIEGAGTGKDSYNRVNALYFLKISSEWFKHTGYTIYAKNLLSSTFLEGRNEQSSTYIKWVGQCNRNEVDLGYLRNPTFDYTEATGYPFRWDGTSIKDFLLFEFKWEDLVPYYHDDEEITNYSCAKDYKFSFVRNLSSITDLTWSTVCGDSWENGFRFTLPAIRIDTSFVKTFYVTSDVATRFQVAYIYNNDGELLTKQDQSSYPAPITFLGRYGISTRGFRNGIEESATMFMVPDDISQIELSIEGKFGNVKVYSKNSYANILAATKSKSGSFGSIPTSGQLGEQWTIEETDVVLTRAKHYWMNPDGTNKSKVTII